MSQLTRLQLALITVILDYNDHQFPPKTNHPETNTKRAETLADKPVKEMYDELQAIIKNFVEQDAKCYQKSGRGPLLQYILYHIVTIGLFLNPPQGTEAVIENQSEADMNSSSVSPELELLNKKALISENDLINGLVQFISNVQILLNSSTSTECEIETSAGKVNIYGFKGSFINGYVASTFCNSGELLHNALFISLGINNTVRKNELEKAILERVKEHQKIEAFSQLVRKNAECEQTIAELERQSAEKTAEYERKIDELRLQNAQEKKEHERTIAELKKPLEQKYEPSQDGHVENDAQADQHPIVSEPPARPQYNSTFRIGLFSMRLTEIVAGTLDTVSEAFT